MEKFDIEVKCELGHSNLVRNFLKCKIGLNKGAANDKHKKKQIKEKEKNRNKIRKPPLKDNIVPCELNFLALVRFVLQFRFGASFNLFVLTLRCFAHTKMHTP